MKKAIKETPIGLWLVIGVMLAWAAFNIYEFMTGRQPSQMTLALYVTTAIVLAYGLFERLNFVRVTSICILLVTFVIQLFPVIIFSKVLIDNPMANNDVTLRLIFKSFMLAVNFGLLDYLTSPDTRIYFKQEVTITDRARRPLFYFGMMGLTASIIALILTGWAHTLLVFLVNITQPILMILPLG